MSGADLFGQVYRGNVLEERKCEGVELLTYLTYLLILHILVGEEGGEGAGCSEGEHSSLFPHGENVCSELCTLLCLSVSLFVCQYVRMSV